eukprot:TRINITY_DN13459_c0_g1_i1.p1 TRINITY_DN13459_c0_g1~~TRINITY_DN13459_c0_g1_i1.p1  ORF type:complete len:864 (+),score=408.68 TRINITY_DN13459_c0_g1_i1:67-2592(+)
MDESAMRALSSLQQQHNLPESFMKRMEDVVMQHKARAEHPEGDLTPTSNGGETSRTSETFAESHIDGEGTEDTPMHEFAGLKGLGRLFGEAAERGRDGVGLRAQLLEAQRERLELMQRVEVTEEQLKQAVARCTGVNNELAQLRRERKAVEEAYRIREDQMRQLSDQTTARLAQLEAEAKNFRNGIKDAVHHRLLIGGEAAAALRAKRPDTLDLVEFIQLTVADKLAQVFKQKDEEQQDNATLLRELQNARSECDRVKQLCEDAESELGALKNDAPRRAARYEERIAQLTADVDHLHAQLEKDRDVSRAAHRLADDLQDRTKLVAGLEAERLTLATRLEAAEKELSGVQASLNADQQQHRQAATEVMFLTKENEALVVRTKNLEDERHTLTTQVRTLQTQLQENLDKYSKELVAAEERMAGRLREELDKFNASSKEEIARIREHTKALADREYGQMRTEKDLAVQEATRAAQRVREVEGEAKQLRIEMRMAEDRARSEIAGLRTDLKVKITEASQLEIGKEQGEDTIQRLELEAACSAKKLDALKAEFYALQMQHSRKVGEMDARVAGLHEQLRIYRDLEAECDDAIENTGRLLSTADDAAHAASVLSQGVPSSANRRIQQSLVLAKRAMGLENQLAVAKQELERQGAAKDKMAGELARMKHLMEDKGQPYRYFIDTLAARDAEIKGLKREVEGAKAELAGEAQDKAKLKDVVDAMQGQMTALKDQREELSAYLHQQLQGQLADPAGGAGDRAERRTARRTHKSRRAKHAPHPDTTSATEGHSSNNTNPPHLDAGRVAIQPPLSMAVGGGVPRGQVTAAASPEGSSEGGTALFEHPLVITA